MKRLYISSAALTLLLSSHVALAQTNTASTTASSTESDGGFFSTVIENVTDIGGAVQEQIQGPESALDRRVQERITNLAANISNRFDGIIARMQNIIDRLTARIEKQASAGYDVSAARTSLNSAQRSLDEAKEHMADIDEAVTEALGSTDPRTKWKSVRAKFISARDAIKIAHGELRNTIITLKGSSQTVTETATTSVTTQ
ncbi:MAG: hypothetical protein RL538_673 [Candidatus Parcubacteria bacterium]